MIWADAKSKIKPLKLAAVAFSVSIALLGSVPSQAVSIAVRKVVKRIDGPNECALKYEIPMVFLVKDGQLTTKEYVRQAQINDTIYRYSGFERAREKYNHQVENEIKCQSLDSSQTISYDMSSTHTKVGARFLNLFLNYSHLSGNMAYLGNSQSILIVDLETGKRITLSDIISTKDLPKLNKLIKRKIDQQPGLASIHYFQGYRNMSEAIFSLEKTITDDKIQYGLRFYFDPGKAADPAAGSINVFVSTKSIKKLLNPNGIFATTQKTAKRKVRRHRRPAQFEYVNDEIREHEQASELGLVETAVEGNLLQSKI